jgi:hypothetical protein
MAIEFTEQALHAKYLELCKQRDAVYEKTAPLEKQLETANLEAERARIKAAAIAAEIDKTLGGASWLQLKKEIAQLARFLSKPYGVLAAK